MNNRTFNEVLLGLCEPDMFNVALSDAERAEIYDRIVVNSKKSGIPCNFLEWRDAAYDAMVEMGFELS